MYILNINVQFWYFLNIFNVISTDIINAITISISIILNYEIQFFITYFEKYNLKIKNVRRSHLGVFCYLNLTIPGNANLDVVY